MTKARSALIASVASATALSVVVGTSPIVHADEDQTNDTVNVTPGSQREYEEIPPTVVQNLTMTTSKGRVLSASKLNFSSKSDQKAAQELSKELGDGKLVLNATLRIPAKYRENGAGIQVFQGASLGNEMPEGYAGAAGRYLEFRDDNNMVYARLGAGGYLSMVNPYIRDTDVQAAKSSEDYVIELRDIPLQLNVPGELGNGLVEIHPNGSEAADFSTRLREVLTWLTPKGMDGISAESALRMLPESQLQRWRVADNRGYVAGIGLSEYSSELGGWFTKHSADAWDSGYGYSTPGERVGYGMPGMIAPGYMANVGHERGKRDVLYEITYPKDVIIDHVVPFKSLELETFRSLGAVPTGSPYEQSVGPRKFDILTDVRDVPAGKQVRVMIKDVPSNVNVKLPTRLLGSVDNDITKDALYRVFVPSSTQARSGVGVKVTSVNATDPSARYGTRTFEGSPWPKVDRNSEAGKHHWKGDKYVGVDRGIDVKFYVTPLYGPNAGREVELRPGEMMEFDAATTNMADVRMEVAAKGEVGQSRVNIALPEGVRPINKHNVDQGRPNPQDEFLRDLTPGAVNQDSHINFGGRGEFTWLVPGGLQPGKLVQEAQYKPDGTLLSPAKYEPGEPKSFNVGTLQFDNGTHEIKVGADGVEPVSVTFQTKGGDNKRISSKRQPKHRAMNTTRGGYEDASPLEGIVIDNALDGNYPKLQGWPADETKPPIVRWDVLNKPSWVDIVPMRKGETQLEFQRELADTKDGGAAYGGVQGATNKKEVYPGSSYYFHAKPGLNVKPGTYTFQVRVVYDDNYKNGRGPGNNKVLGEYHWFGDRSSFFGKRAPGSERFVNDLSDWTEKVAGQKEIITPEGPVYLPTTEYFNSPRMFNGQPGCMVARKEARIIGEGEVCNKIDPPGPRINSMDTIDVTVVVEENMANQSKLHYPPMRGALSEPFTFHPIAIQNVVNFELNPSLLQAASMGDSVSINHGTGAVTVKPNSALMRRLVDEQSSLANTLGRELGMNPLSVTATFRDGSKKTVPIKMLVNGAESDATSNALTKNQVTPLPLQVVAGTTATTTIPNSLGNKKLDVQLVGNPDWVKLEGSTTIVAAPPASTPLGPVLGVSARVSVDGGEAVEVPVAIEVVKESDATTHDISYPPAQIKGAVDITVAPKGDTSAVSSYEAPSLPKWASIDTTTGVVTGTAPAYHARSNTHYPVKVTFKDGSAKQIMLQLEHFPVPQGPGELKPADPSESIAPPKPAKPKAPTTTTPAPDGGNGGGNTGDDGAGAGGTGNTGSDTGDAGNNGSGNDSSGDNNSGGSGNNGSGTGGNGADGTGGSGDGSVGGRGTTPGSVAGMVADRLQGDASRGDAGTVTPPSLDGDEYARETGKHVKEFNKILDDRDKKLEDAQRKNLEDARNQLGNQGGTGNAGSLAQQGQDRLKKVQEDYDKQREALQKKRDELAKKKLSELQSERDKLLQEIAELEKKHQAYIAATSEVRKDQLQLNNPVYVGMVKEDIASEVRYRGYIYQAQRAPLEARVADIDKALELAEIDGPSAGYVSMIGADAIDKARREHSKWLQDALTKERSNSMAQILEHQRQHMLTAIDRELEDLRAVREKAAAAQATKDVAELDGQIQRLQQVRDVIEKRSTADIAAVRKVGFDFADYSGDWRAYNQYVDQGAHYRMHEEYRARLDAIFRDSGNTFVRRYRNLLGDVDRAREEAAESDRRMRGASSKGLQDMIAQLQKDLQRLYGTQQDGSNGNSTGQGGAGNKGDGHIDEDLLQIGDRNGDGVIDEKDREIARNGQQGGQSGNNAGGSQGGTQGASKDAAGAKQDGKQTKSDAQKTQASGDLAVTGSSTKVLLGVGALALLSLLVVAGVGIFRRESADVSSN